MREKGELQAAATGGGVNLLIQGFALGPFATNCYVVSVAGSDAAWIVDAGFEPADLIEHVRGRGLKPEKIILTHAHVDHIAGLEEVRRAFPGVTTLIHEAEASFLEDPMLNLSGAYGFPVTARPAEHLLHGGETLELAGTKWKVLHTPGHSPGGITLVCDGGGSGGAGVALVGDTLFAGSIGRFDFPTSDEAALMKSIREKLYTLPDGMRVLPGHGPETTIGEEKRTNPYVRASPT